MTERPPARRPRRRRRRGRRTALLVLVALLVAGAAVALGFSLGGDDTAAPPTTTTSAARPAKATAHPQPAKAPKTSQVDRLTKLGYPVYCGGGRGKYVALTFDDGPGPYTQFAINILRREGARATFFIVGRNVGLWPKMPKRELALATLGDHTWTHAYLPSLSAEEMASEIKSAKDAIVAASGRPVKLFRPPYGAHNAAIDREAHALGMLEVIWSIDSRDSLGADPEGIRDNVLRAVKPGSIVLLHENRGQALKGLKWYLLPGLRQKGLVPVTVEELLERDPPTLAQLRAGVNGC